MEELSSELIDYSLEELWDRRFLNIAKEVSTWSQDPSVGVGAVIVKNHNIISVDCNRFADMLIVNEERLHDRELKYRYTIHAEVNAILRAGHACKGATIFVYPAFGSPPLCVECCKAVIQAGITKVVGLSPANLDDEIRKRWKDSIAISRSILHEVLIPFEVYEE